MYKKGLRQNLTFDTAKGSFTIQDMFQCPLSNGIVNLYDVGNKLYQESQACASAGPFGAKENDAQQKLLKLKLDIISDIIETKQAELRAAEEAEARAAKKKRIMAKIAAKQEEAEDDLTVEELTEIAEEL